MGADLEAVAAFFAQGSETAARRSSGTAKEYFLAETTFASISSASGGAVAVWIVSEIENSSGTLVMEVDVPPQWRGKVRPTVRRLSDFMIEDGLLASFTVDGRSLREFVCPLAGDGANGWLLARTVADIPVVLVTSLGLLLDGRKPARGRSLEISAWCESESRALEMLSSGWAIGREWCAALRLQRGESMPIADIRAVRLEGTPAGAVRMVPDTAGVASASSAVHPETGTASDMIVVSPPVSAAVQRRMPDATIEEVLQVEIAAEAFLRAGQTLDGQHSDVGSAVDLAIELFRLGNS